MTVTALPDSPDLLDIVTGKIQDDSGALTASEIDAQIAEALRSYSRIRPRELAADVTGNAAHDYAITLLTGYVEDFSVVRQVEYPVDSMPAEVLDDDDWQMYRAVAGLKLRLINDVVPVTSTFRVTYTAVHTTETVPANDIDAVANLAASRCLEVMANRWLQTGDPTIAADSVNYRTKSQEAASRAKAMLKLYTDHLGVKPEDSVPAASAIGDIDVGYPGGYDRLTHPTRARRKRFS